MERKIRVLISFDKMSKCEKYQKHILKISAKMSAKRGDVIDEIIDDFGKPAIDTALGFLKDKVHENLDNPEIEMALELCKDLKG